MSYFMNKTMICDQISNVLLNVMTTYNIYDQLLIKHRDKTLFDKFDIAKLVQIFYWKKYFLDEK